jgi:Uncharacterized protein conserved in bacteria (DUF2325)
MRISLVGGMDRLERQYRIEAEKRGYELRVFNGPEVNMSSKLASSDAVVLFTGKVSHEARILAVAATKSYGIPLLQCHSCGVCSFRDCLACIARQGGGIGEGKPAGQGRKSA